jgi:hypothetical protein
MTHRQAIQARERLLKRLPSAAEVLRGSLIERTTRHTSGCPKCASGDGHPQTVLTISYPGGRTRQFSLSSEQVPQVRQWLKNYQALKAKMEAICELNHILLRPDTSVSKARSRRHD